MSNPKNCIKCGMQKRHHPDSKYLQLFTESHEFEEKTTKGEIK